MNISLYCDQSRSCICDKNISYFSVACLKTNNLIKFTSIMFSFYCNYSGINLEVNAHGGYQTQCIPNGLYFLLPSKYAAAYFII